MQNYVYTPDIAWFLGSEIRAKLLNFVNAEERRDVLELGSFEGLSSVFFADNILEHPESTLTCVDPFLREADNDHSKFLDGVEEHFDQNIARCRHPSKVKIYKTTSDEFFQLCEKKTYDLIYIDGCHRVDNIRRDMENSLKVLRPGGVMWMDDYRGGGDDAIKTVMDDFCSRHHVAIIHIGYQLALRKL